MDEIKKSGSVEALEVTVLDGKVNEFSIEVVKDHGIIVRKRSELRTFSRIGGIIM